MKRCHDCFRNSALCLCWNLVYAVQAQAPKKVKMTIPVDRALDDAGVSRAEQGLLRR